MSTTASRTRGARVAAALVVAVLATISLLASAGSAEAANYRYWGYYSWTKGSWAFSTKGPAQTNPADGSVEGWRFAVSAATGSPRVPRADGNFAEICAGTKAATGKKRVAVVIDPGLPADAPAGDKPPAPRGACALVDPAASGAQVLAAVANDRVEKGLVCAVDGYPSKGCGDQVSANPPAGADAKVALALPATKKAADSSKGGGSTPWAGIAIAAVLVAALGGGALWRARSGAHT